MISADEKFVRANWEHVRSWVRDLDSYGTDQFNVALFFNEKDAKWCDNPFERWQMDVGKEKAVWKLAAEFTRNRLKEIDITWKSIQYSRCLPNSDEVDFIISLLTVKYDDVRRGMKGGIMGTSGVGSAS